MSFALNAVVKDVGREIRDSTPAAGPDSCVDQAVLFLRA